MTTPVYTRWAPPKAATKKKPLIAPSPPTSAPKPPTESPAKKPKKRKRESRVDEQVEIEAPSTPKKHKAILSKFEKSSKLVEAARASAKLEPEEDEEETAPAEVLHDLGPLPQPAPIPEPAFEPTFSTLPAWLANPVSVKSSKVIPFSELGVHSFFLKKLEKQGYKDALAVQSALLPMLHPGFEQHLGDMCVSAKTGSGKTLAYLLPIIEALKDRVVTTLSAIVVVPTRQLVDQALTVAEELCAGTKLKVGTAVGNIPFATEQKLLVKTRAHYDPKRAEELHERAMHQLESGIVERAGILHDLESVPADHVPQYDSGFDILICTPGRLVEHLESTTGFLLRSVRWLVIDEADQLLNQNFQGWATVLMDSLHGETPEDFMNAQEQLRKRRQNSSWSIALPERRNVTKIVLSATIRKDLTKLGSLKLKRPKLVVVEDETPEASMATDGDVFELPSTLDEFAIPVGDGSNKPLYLLYLLINRVFQNQITGAEQTSEGNEVFAGSDSDSSSDDSDEESGQPGALDGKSMSKNRSRILIFTKSNESASRLTHLLSILEPTLTPFTKTMTPSSTDKAAKRLLKSFTNGAFKILIASDAASRGLDIPDITHVINYDVPSGITSYVHRVGRTARANKAGEAWTLFTKTEAAWFWKQVATGGTVKRGTKKVARVELKKKSVTWNRRKTYQAALLELQGAVGAGD
ncbi:P-loop containing nucleoside triphosphate hydrolase protein [Melanomma pulvis-pyrius CBS 109.77]|uniref:ATP-dependent RNA helicase n=1 Tax=Melanomma pulvis-pyrius CBS 109.77 TaxID=1314802 RepID=A0A6A6WUV6_9PLEO|nr:P-loop containing nucleoside triphosphate hydrolase protein [Melanomma pulvis-pyrius CBS 109.77]